jgi:hypothetical protein
MPATEPATAWNKEGATRQLAGEFALRLDSPSEFTKLGSPLRIPFQGLLKYPEQSRFRSGETIPLIKGGTLLLIGQSIIGDELYELGKVELAVGDTVVPIELPGQSVGLFAVGDEAGIELSVRFVARSVRILRFSSNGYSARATWVSRIVNDKPLQLVWIALCFVITAANKVLFPKEGKSQ